MRVQILTIKHDAEDYLRDFYKQVNEHLAIIQEKEKERGSLSQAFAVIGNRIAICGDITHYHIERIAGKKSKFNKEDLGKRLLYVYRDVIFAGMMSTIEYYFIKTVLMYPDLDAAKRILMKGPGCERRVNFSDLIGWVKDMLDDYYLWDFAVKLRNDIVHYDAIARHTVKSPNIEFPINMKQGQMSVGKLRSILSLSKGIDNSYFKFVLGLVEGKLQ
jgi:hypothetical protein